MSVVCITYVELFTSYVSGLYNLPRTLRFVCQRTGVTYPRVLPLRALLRLRLVFAHRWLTSVSNQDDGDKADERKKETAQERSPHHLFRDPHLLSEEHAIHWCNQRKYTPTMYYYKYRTRHRTLTTRHVRKCYLIRGTSPSFVPLYLCPIIDWCESALYVTCHAHYWN